MLELRPLKDLYTLPGGTYTELPTTREGIRAMRPFPFIGASPGLRVLTMTSREEGGRSITALCGRLPAAAFLDGRVRHHELTLAGRLSRQEAHVREDGGALGKPVLLTVDRLTLPPGEPPTTELSFLGRQYHYHLSRPLPPTRYPLPTTPIIADGHHRATAHARLAAAGYAPCSYIPVVIAPLAELSIYSFYRQVRPSEGSPDVVEALRKIARVEAVDPVAYRHRRGEWLVETVGAAYRLLPLTDARELDGQWLNNHVLPLAFDIHDVRFDDRISFSIERPPLESGSYLFSGAPLSRELFLRETSDGRSLPPKSTCFQPRIPSGLLVTMPG